jgi:enoyl-CoA hydratase/carnithine racemase
VKAATVITESQEGVTLLTLNRPERLNAFNDPQYDDVRAALAAARADDSVSVVVVTGSGRGFSAGQDLGEMGGAHKFTPFMEELSTFDKPIVVAVNGVAVGIGFTLLLHCDVVYVGESARLRAPFTSLGLVPEAGSSLLLPLVIGPQRAAEIFLTSRWVTAAEAVELGLAARLVPNAELLPTALTLAREMAAQPLASLRETKRLLLAIRADALRAARAREDEAMARRAGSPENLEAIRALQKKRTKG